MTSRVAASSALLFALGLWVTAMRASRSRVLRMDPAPKGNGPPPLSPMRKLWRRMTASRVIEGHVQDGITGRPIVGARLVVLDQETVSTAGGAFRIGPFDLARVALDVGADGYAGERFDIELPTSDAQHVMLWSWREKVLRRFAEVAAKLLPGPPLGQRTLADLRRDGLALLGPAGPAFAEIIERLEDACYAPRGLDADRFRALLEAVSILEHTSPSVPHTATPQPGAQRVPMGPDTDGA